MKTFPFTQECVQNVLDGWEYEVLQVGIMDKYTGRGMNHGCIAFMASEVKQVTKLLVGLAMETEAEGVYGGDLIEAIGNMRTDNFGHNIVAYFPDYIEFAEKVETEPVELHESIKPKTAENEELLP